MYAHVLLHSQSQHTHRGAGKVMAAAHGAEYHSSYDASTKKQTHTAHVFKVRDESHGEELKKKLEKSKDVNHVHISKDSGHVLKESEELTEGLGTPNVMAKHAEKATHHQNKINHHMQALKNSSLSDAEKDHHKKAVVAHSAAFAHHDSAARGHNFAISAKEAGIASRHADSYKD